MFNREELEIQTLAPILGVGMVVCLVVIFVSGGGGNGGGAVCVVPISNPRPCIAKASISLLCQILGPLC